MKAISWLEQALIAGALLKEVTPVVRQNRAEKALVTLCVGLGLVGLGFLLYWGFSWAAAQYGTREAALIIGAVTWVIAILCVAGFLAIKAIKKKRLKAVGKYSEDMLLSVLSMIEQPVRDNPKLGILFAVLAGYKAGQAVHDNS